MTNEWTQAMEKAVDTVKNETLEALKRDAQERGFFLDTETMLDEYIQAFVRGLNHAFVDMKAKMCKDIDKDINDWLADGW